MIISNLLTVTAVLPRLCILDRTAAGVVIASSLLKKGDTVCVAWDDVRGLSDGLWSWTAKLESRLHDFGCGHDGCEAGRKEDEGKLHCVGVCP